MNYSELQEAITSTAMRQGDDEFEAAVPTFIRLAEARINRMIRTLEMERTDTLSMTDGAATLPADYLQYRTVIAGGNPRQALKLITPDEAAWFDVAGTPRFFTISGNTIQTVPASSGDLVLNYYASIPPLSDAEPTNWCLTRNPDLYLYGALLEASTFMFDDQRMATWGTKFDLAVRAINADDEMAKYANATARVRGATP